MTNQTRVRLVGGNEVRWSGLRIRISTFISDVPTPPDLTTTAFALTFDAQGGILMTNHARRGWDIPGGHIEPGETPVEAAQRETHEETAVAINDLVPVGYDKLEVLDPRPDGYRYPYPVSYQAFFVARDFQVIGQVTPDTEVLEATFVDPARAATSRWIQNHFQLVQFAFRDHFTGNDGLSTKSPSANDARSSPGRDGCTR